MFSKKMARVLPAIFVLLVVEMIVSNVMVTNEPGANSNGNSRGNEFNLPNIIAPSAITATNQYTGSGAPLTLQEWADSRNVTVSRSLIGAGTTTADLLLAEGWYGYKLYTNVYNLYDTDEWNQFAAMPFDGTSNVVNNVVWNFGRDAAGANVETGVDINTPDQCCNVNLHPANTTYGGNPASTFTANDNAYWQQLVAFPRGQITAMWVAWDYWKGTWDTVGFSGWEMTRTYASINGTYAYELSSPNMGASNQWNSVALQQVPQSIITALNTVGTPGTIQFRVGLRSTQSFQCTPRVNAYMRFRNVRLFIRAKCLPTQVNLRVAFNGVGGNGGAQNVIQNIGTTHGTGQLNFTATPQPWLAGASPLNIVSTFTTSAIVHFPADNLEIVQFDMYQVIYGRHWRDTQVDANALAIAGANFVAANNTNIDWITFFYDRPPQIASGTQDNYINYLFNGTKPSDWDIYQVLDSQPVDKTTNLTGRQSGNTIISMSRLYAGFYGFWTFSAHSPNYVQSMAVPTNLYEGQLLRINGSINPGLAAGYITSTRAELTIKFPNGTIWSSVNRNVLVGSGGSVQFPSITIPTSGANYVAGVYTAILTWNNSRSGLPLNETGSMVRTFTIRHRATLTSEFPSQVYYDNLNTQQALPIQLRYVDIGGSDITDATITFTNFNSQVQTFTHQNAYFNYITLLNCTNGPRGLNNIVINAISPAFEPKTINIGVEIVRTANFTIDQYPSVSTQWNDNFFLTLHYTDALNGSGINIDSPNNITVAWPQVAGRYSVDMSQRVNGIYTLTFNTSGTMPDQLYSVPISIKKIGCQGRSIIMDISVTPRSTSLNLVPIPDVAYGDSMIVNSNFKAISSGALITGATATARIVETATVCAVATFPNGTYRFSLDTWSLPSLGTYTLNVTIWWSGVPYYANQTRTLTFNVIQRTTQAYASGTFDIKYWNSNFTVLLYYIDVLNSSSIRGSNVHITISAWDGVNPLSQVNTLTSITYNGTTGPWLLTFNASHFGRTNMAPGFRVDIAITWTASTKPYYVDRSVTFTIKVDEAPTFIYIKDPSRQTVPTGSNHTITFNLINQRSGTGISGQQGNIVVTSSGILPDNEVFNPAIGITFPNNNGSYVLMFNISKLAGDYVSFNISITMSNYVDIVNYAFTLIKISPVPITEIIGVDQVYLGQQMNMTIFFHLVGLLTGIPGAAVSVQDGPSSGVWAGGTFSYLYDGSQYYNITFTPSFSHAHVNQARSYSVFVNFTSSSGNSQVRVNFVVNPIPTNITNVYFNGIDRTGSLPTFSLYLGDSVNVSVYFHNLFNSTAVSGASVILTRAGYSGTLVRTGATYSLFVNTNLFGVGPFEFTVSATRNSFQQASQKIKLDIQAVSTNATIYLNGTQNNSMILYYGQNIRIGFIYRDTHNNVPLISPSVSRTLTGGATVVSGSSFVLNGNTWEVVLNTAAIGSPGTYFMTITAGLANYQTALATFTITINDIQTSLVVCNDQGNSQTSYSLYWGRSLSIALLYRSLVTGLNITGATMTRTGLLANSSFSVNGNWYNYTFNTATVVPNVYTISISASMANRTSPTVQITVSVLAITTTLEVYNGTTPTTSFMQYYRENVTIRLRLFDTVNSLPVLGVTFITAYGYIVSAGGGYYDLTVNSTFGGGIGIAQFTVTGQRANYVSSSEVITINVLSIPTSYRVFINGTDRTATLQETINFLESFDITIYYNDTFRTRPITGATITLTIT
nr:hypothetical protein [Candidatus Sigynarchaeota archaeon]